jgi:phospholipid/cholesterol/gamma-HCH transport system ATP-binding protein
MPPAVEYRNIVKSFDAPVLAGVSFTVERGEILSVLGRSGTGKSVLLKTTIGLIEPDGGDVLVNGRSLFEGHRALDDIRRNTGYVFQNAALFDSLTVRENVMQGLPEAELQRLASVEVDRRVADALTAVHLDPAAVLDRLPGELSGGMRKRVGIARAIVGRPPLLLYDEPVTGLDPVTSAIITRLIVLIAEHTRATSVIVTHDVDAALAISHRVVLLDQGKVVFQGTPAEFRRSDAKLVRAFADRNAAMAAALASNGEGNGVFHG